MQIEVSDYVSISYVRFNKPLNFDLAQIKQCSIIGDIFEVVSCSGAIASYRKDYIKFEKKDS